MNTDNGRAILIAGGTSFVVIIVSVFVFGVVVVEDKVLRVSDTINYFGIIVTIFSLSVTVFLVVMAVNAFGYTKQLDSLLKKYEAVLLKVENEHNTLVSIRRATSMYIQGSVEIFNRSLRVRPEDNLERLNLSSEFMVNRSLFELRTVDREAEQFEDDFVSNALTVVEKGKIRDLDVLCDELFENKVAERDDLLALIYEKKRFLRTAATGE